MKRASSIIFILEAVKVPVQNKSQLDLQPHRARYISQLFNPLVEARVSNDRPGDSFFIGCQTAGFLSSELKKNVNPVSIKASRIHLALLCRNTSQVPDAEEPYKKKSNQGLAAARSAEAQLKRLSFDMKRRELSVWNKPLFLLDLLEHIMKKIQR